MTDPDALAYLLVALGIAAHAFSVRGRVVAVTIGDHRAEPVYVPTIIVSLVVGYVFVATFVQTVRLAEFVAGWARP